MRCGRGRSEEHPLDEGDILVSSHGGCRALGRPSLTLEASASVVLVIHCSGSHLASENAQGNW